MELPAFIRSLGVDEFAELVKEKPRQVRAWMHRERIPRPKTAKKIERRTKGKVSIAECYAQVRPQ